MPGFAKNAQRLFTPTFVVAALILGSAAALSGPVARALSLRRIKEPLPLRNSLSMLDQLDSNGLAPYRLLSTRHHPTGKVIIDATTVQNLGTEDYIMWYLEDTSVPEDSPVRTLALFVTYYTGGNDLVPHTPDACYSASGYNLKLAETHPIDVPAVADQQGEVRARVCTFTKTGVMDRDEFHVIYFFYCNGDIVPERNDVRLRVNNLTSRYAFFSKVEVKFPAANKEQSIEGAAKLLGRIGPLLIENHWPDYEAAEAAAGEAGAQEST